MSYYAVIDTNVLIAALLTKNNDAATVKVLRSVFNGEIVPLYHNKILAEYDEVLHRKKFGFKDSSIHAALTGFKHLGKEVVPKPTGKIFTDTDDLIFYEIAVEKRNEGAYLVTGNLNHFPCEDFIVSPARMIEIIQQNKDK